MQCDVEKPCILCVRAGITCEPQLSTPDSPLKRKRSLHSDAGPRAKSSAPGATSAYVQHHVPPGATNTSCSPSADHAYPAGRSYFNDAKPELAALSRTSPAESQQYGANDSTMHFAKIVLGEDDDNDSPASGTIPGDAQR